MGHNAAAGRREGADPLGVRAGTCDWRTALPVLRGAGVTLRGLDDRDAASLWAHIGNPNCGRFMVGAPRSLEQLQRFLRWSREQQRHGQLVCYGVVPVGHHMPVGVIQLWSVESDFATAEWGFVVGETYWGTGLFGQSATVLLNFAFGTLGVRRLEARSVDINERANAALRRLGATFEGVLREGFFDGTDTHDHLMWSLLAREWLARQSRRDRVAI